MIKKISNARLAIDLFLVRLKMAPTQLLKLPRAALHDLTLSGGSQNVAFLG